MLLTLFRHGIAQDTCDSSTGDAGRELTREGIAKTREAALGLANLIEKPALIFCSPLVRARQTAELACQALKLKSSAIEVTEALLPNADASEIFNLLSGYDAESALCCGHAPHIDEAIAIAVGSPFAFTGIKKAGCACLELISVYPPRAELRWFMGPNMLANQQVGES